MIHHIKNVLKWRKKQVKVNLLFNTLSMIFRHIQTDDKQTRIRLVKETSILLRNSLKTTLTITLDEELELLRSYLW
ncbi:MAG: histidine kinase [Spirochaetia bacterium]|nr:histidine kinase [Spirochaetia bacterium]